MNNKILITSFDIWKSHHLSNASDDLIETMIQQNLFAELDSKMSLLRKLPVDFQLAPQFVIAEIDAFQPNIVVCCGMAECRSLLTVESNGKHQAKVLWTTVDVDRLVDGLVATNVSHDAGTFVCNHLYYSVLQHIRDRRLTCQALFVHVPILNEVNLAPVVKDFLAILKLFQQTSIQRQTTL